MAFIFSIKEKILFGFLSLSRNRYSLSFVSMVSTSTDSTNHDQKYFLKNNPESFKKQNVNFLRTSNYLQFSGPQPFWHQRPVSWKAVFPRTGDWEGRVQAEIRAMVQAVMPAMGSDGERQMELRSPACCSTPAVQPGS